MIKTLIYFNAVQKKLLANNAGEDCNIWSSPGDLNLNVLQSSSCHIIAINRKF